MASVPHPRSPDLLSAAESLLLMVDLQERLMPHVAGSDAVTANCVRLVRGAERVGVPITLTEQYPAGLGPTVADLAAREDDRPEFPSVTVEKLRFSGAEAIGWPAAGDRTDGRYQVVLAGVETHICVLQTAFDLLSMGYRVWVAADATASRFTTDREVALSRLRDGGVSITTVEAILFEWCEVAGTETFKAIRSLVTER